MSERSTLDAIFEYFSGTVEWVVDIFSDPDNFAALMRHLGWDVDPGSFDLNSFMNKFSGLAPLVSDVQTTVALAAELIDANADRKFQIYGEIASMMPEILDAVDDLSNITFGVGDLPAPLDSQAFYDYIPEFPRRLLDFCITTQLEYTHPRMYATLVLSGVIKIDEVIFNSPEPGRVDYIKREVQWESLSNFLSSPDQVLNQLYHWNDPGKDLDITRLITNIERLISAFDIPVCRYRPTPKYLQKYYQNMAMADIPQGLRIPFYDGTDPDVGAYVSLGFYIIPIPPNDANHPSAGILLSPYAIGKAAVEFPLSEQFSLILSGNLATGTEVGIEFRPGSIVFVSDDPAALAETQGKLILKTTSTEPLILFGTSGGTRFEIGEFSTNIEAKAGGSETPELTLGINLEDASIVIQASDGDGFLQKILPRDPLYLKFDLRFGISNQRGLYISGSAGLEYTVHLNKTIGPIFVSTIDLGLVLSQNGIELITAISGGASIGPVAVAISKIGLKTVVEFGKPGVLGKADLSLGFKLPDGIGLSIDAAVVRGGGYIGIDPPNYTGVLALSISDFVDVSAIALITTRLPDGRKGFSMVLLISARFQPIQIGFGFALTGVGGVIGIHRAMNEEALREVFKSHSLDYLLFPDEDVIADAVAVIDAVRSVFPPYEDRHTFGLMGEIIWGGTLPIVTFRFGLIIEVGGDGKVAILGQAKVVLPDEEAPILILNMDLMGFIDFGNETLAIDSSLYDSRILIFGLYGDMALRTSWGDNSDFALSIGGFNPRFVPPPGFPALRRMTIGMRKGPASLVLTSYLAVTSNTFQTGAALVIKVDLEVVYVSGGAGFDALIHFKPFSFITDFYAWLKVVMAGATIAHIDVRLTLSGPNPFHAKGYAMVKLFLLPDITVEINEKFGDKVEEKPKIFSPFDEFIEQLEDPRNIRTRLPAWSVPSVSLSGHVKDEQLLDPDGDLIFEQNTVPLELLLERFAEGVPPANERYLRMDLSDSSANLPASVVSQPVTRPFSPGKFRNWSDDALLSSSAFDDFQAGKSWKGSFISSTTRHMTTGTYETIICEPTQGEGPSSSQPAEEPRFDQEQRAAWRLQAGRLRHRPFAKQKNPAHRKFVQVVKPSFTVTTDNAVDGAFERVLQDEVAVVDMTYTEASDLALNLGGEGLTVRDTAFAAGVGGSR